MPGQHHRRRKGRHRGAAAKANADLMSHVVSLGLEGVEQYRNWCREHGFTGALNKGWQERRKERTAARREVGRKKVDASLRKHIEALGLETLEEYRAWCLAQGLSQGSRKASRQRRKELELAIRLKNQTVLSGMKQHARRPQTTIQQIYAGDVDVGELRLPYLQKVQEAFAGHEDDPHARKALQRLMNHSMDYADLFGVKPALSGLGQETGNTFIEGMSELARHHNDWIRPVENWRPKTHNSRRQFGSLARHLLAKYDVPPFMDAVWLLGDRQEARLRQAWFKHIGVGHNIWTTDLPVNLTKKMAHVFLHAPAYQTVDEALRRGQILGLGGDERLVREVIGTRLGASFENEAFWSTVIHFFVNHPFLDPDQVGPIVDYIHNQKYVPQEIVGPGGVIEHGNPPQPNFAMKGRSVNKLVRLVEGWHRRLGKETRIPNKQWSPSTIFPFNLTEKKGGAGVEVRWSIQELLSTRELTAEGRVMHHCVGSYANNCQRGKTSVWSMQVEDTEGVNLRVMTIALKNRNISQARGKYNALPSGKIRSGKQRAMAKLYREYLKQSRRILHLWVEQEGLLMPRYV